MTARASFSASGFSVTANNAIDLIAGTQAAGSGMVSANIQGLAQTMHADLGRVSQQIATQTAQLSDINFGGFKSVGDKLSQGFGSVEALSGVSIAVQAAGFAVVAKQLHSLRGDVKSLHADMVRQGEELIDLQQITNAGIERLVDFAERQLKTQEKILEVLISSRTVEAQQLIRQGWDNLKNGYEDEAFERFKKSLEFDNTVYMAHAELGRILENLNDLKTAEDHLIRASKFASLAGPLVEGFSLVQLAGFYERRGRVDEAIIRVRDALARDNQKRWRFYLCELLALRGNNEEAFALLRLLINTDADYHAAAAGSASLLTLQPKLTVLLLEIDVQRRSAVLDALGLIGPTITAFEVLNIDAATIATVRSNGAAILEQALTRPFVDLERLGELALQAVQQARSRIDDTCTRAANEVLQLRDSISTQIQQTPHHKEPIRTEAVLANVKAIAAFIVSGIVGCCALGIVLGRNEGESTKPFWILAAFSLGAVVVGLAFRADRESALAEHQGVTGPVIEQWIQWHSTALSNVQLFEAGRADVAAKLEKIPGIVRSQRVETALRNTRSIASPVVPNPPAWATP